jgi:hypothetical protein
MEVDPRPKKGMEFSAMSINYHASQAPTNIYSTPPSDFSTAKRGAGQTKSVASKEIVPSKGTRALLPDYEEIDMKLPPARAAGKRPVLNQTESSMGNGYKAIRDASSSGLVEPNAIISCVSG